jgi:hypothetical protein
MTAILRRLPYLEASTQVRVGQESVPVKSYQIIIWVSLGPPLLREWDARLPRLPAILDTGHNHYFSIQESHLRRWGGLHPESLPERRSIRERGQTVRLRRAILWLYRNRPGEVTPLDSKPVQFDLPEGIAVYPDSADFPRLPLLGLRALTKSRLRLTIDGRRLRVGLRTSPAWWPF